MDPELAGGPLKPWKFDERRRRAYLAEMRKGGGRHASARKIGLTPKTVERAMFDEDGKPTPFNEAVRRAEAEATEGVENRCYEEAMAGNARLIEFYLTNRAPGRWKKTEHREFSGPEGGPIPVEVQVRAKEDFVSRVEQAAQRVNGNGHTVPALPAGGGPGDV